MLHLLRFILIFILVVFLLSFIFRLIINYFFKRLGKKYGGHGYNEESKPEGEVHVSRSPKKDKVVDKSVGEYIDYEEVKGDD